VNGTTATNTTAKHGGFRRGGFATLTAALDYAARGSGALQFFDKKGRLKESLGHAELRRRALGIAGGLAKLGVGRGDRVALVAETGPGFATSLFACFYAGAIAVPIPTARAIGSADSYRARLERQLVDCAPIALIGSTRSPDDLRAAGAAAGVGIVVADGEIDPDPRATFQAVAADDVAYVQYSSGSTRAPRGVVLTHRQVAQNCTDILERLDVTPSDRGVFWLPWFHDMGLVGGLLAPICSQSQVAFLSPEDFIRRPLVWLELMLRGGERSRSGPALPSTSVRVSHVRARLLLISCLGASPVWGPSRSAAISSRHLPIDSRDPVFSRLPLSRVMDLPKQLSRSR